MKLHLLLFIFPTLISLSALAGYTVGNGGDAMECDFDNNGKYEYYTLDYVLAQDGQAWTGGEFNEMEHLEYISKVIKDTSLSYYMGLGSTAGFIASYKSKLRGEEDYWVPMDLPLVDIKDEVLDGVEIPEECKKQIHQSVIKDPGHGTKFYYDRQIEGKLSPQQLHVRNVHEMLRTFFVSSKKIRALNRLLHHPDVIKLTQEYNIEQTLRDFNIAEDDWDLIHMSLRLHPKYKIYRDALKQGYPARLNVIVENVYLPILDKIRVTANNLYKPNATELAQLEKAERELDLVKATYLEAWGFFHHYIWSATKNIQGWDPDFGEPSTYDYYLLAKSYVSCSWGPRGQNTFTKKLAIKNCINKDKEDFLESIDRRIEIVSSLWIE